MQIFLDHASTTPLSDSMKEYLTSVLDIYGNPSSLHSVGDPARQILSKARRSVARFINADEREIYFTPSGSGGNTMAVKGIVSDDPGENPYEAFYSPTAHKSMVKACQSCRYHTPLKVNSDGEIDTVYLDEVLTRHNGRRPLVCIEAANSEIGTQNDVIAVGYIVHKHNGLFVVDVTGYIPSHRVTMNLWRHYVDLLTFSGHKLRALKGIGVLWKKKDVALKPFIFGTQQDGIAAGTENILGIASLGKAVEDYDYSLSSPANRDYVYDYIMNHIPDCYLVGASVASGNRLPHNLYVCFQGVEGESLMILLDMNGIQVSTGSACNSQDAAPSAVLTAIGMKEEDIPSCIRLSFSGLETREELDYVNEKLKQCVEALRRLNTRRIGS